MYIRFETPGGFGLFHAARELRETPARWRRLSPQARRALISLERELFARTPVPPPDAYSDTTCSRPRTWFKEDAERHLALAWELHALMTRAGARVRPIRAIAATEVLWEDEVQVVMRSRGVRKQWVRKPACPARWDGDRETIRGAAP